MKMSGYASLTRPTWLKFNSERRITAIKLSVGEHIGSPLQPMNMGDFVGNTCVSALNLKLNSSGT